jgi:hypothetical protein
MKYLVFAVLGSIIAIEIRCFTTRGGLCINLYEWVKTRDTELLISAIMGAIVGIIIISPLFLTSPPSKNPN